MTSDLEKSFKAKLRAIAQEKRRDTADLWQNLVLERFLVRLSHSSYRRHFVLKGAILLAHYIDIGRETRDLDFHAWSLSNEVHKLRAIFEEISIINLKDGFVFREISARELTHPHMGYPGAEVTMTAYFGHTHFKVFIDIGFGDIVNAIEKPFPLMSYTKGPLFERSAELMCYPKEFIFAEKLETIVHRGSFNSRMKDFHDLYSLTKVSNNLPFQNLETIIHSVFKHRGTSLTLPINYSDEGTNQLQGYWNAYLKNLRQQDLEKLPAHIAQLLTTINDWLLNNLKI